MELHRGKPLFDRVVVALVFILICLPTCQCKKLVVKSVLVTPFLSACRDTTNGTTPQQFEGYIADLLEEVAKLANLSFTFSIRHDQVYGHRLPNGSWNGLIGDVLTGEADLAAGPLTETSERSRVVDFSTPFMNFGPSIILKRPQAPVMTLEERLQRLFSPLSQSIWMLSGLAWMVTSVVLYIVCHVNPYDWRRLAKDRQATLREGESFSCLNTFWFTMSNILWQGYTRSPRSMGARIVVTFWWLYVLIFVVLYIASMTNYLRVGPTQNVENFYGNIHNLEEFARQKGFRIEILRGGATEQFLASSKIPAIVKVLETIRRRNNYFDSLDNAVKKVRNARKPLSVIAESAMAKFFVTQAPCDVYMVGDFTTIGSYSLAFPINSSLVRDVDFALLKLRESGVLRELEDRWFSGACTGFLVENNSNRLQVAAFHGVDLGTFSGALIILGVGLILGSIVTCIEVFIFKYAEGENKQKEEVKNSVAPSETANKPLLVSSLEPEPITDV